MRQAVWINLLIGIWLIIAPFALPATAARAAWATNDVILGILLIAASAWMLAVTVLPLGAAWFEILCGIWLIVAPFAMGYRTMQTAMWNDVICGIVSIIVAAIAAQAGSRRPTIA